MSEALPFVDAADIIRFVGPTYYDRGRAYAKNGAVGDIDWNGRELSAAVEGSGRLPYRCTVGLTPTGGRYSHLRYSRCSCPMGFDCKHVAALLLTSNARNVELVANTGAMQTDAAPAADWKASVAALTGATAASALPAPARSPLGLLFELRELVRASRNRWSAPTAIAASAPLDPGGSYRLGVRPVMLSATGNWVRGNLGWNSLGYQVNRLDLDQEQLRWFAQFAALHRAGRDVYSQGQEPDWLYLDEFQSPLLWRLLDDAAQGGLTFVTGKKGTAVSFGAARVSVEVAAADGLRLTTRLTVDGEERPFESARAIGEHGVYVFDLPARFLLAPLPAEQARLLTRPRQTTIPAADADEFLRDFYPALGRTVEVTSADIDLPEIPPPTLVLTLTYSARNLLTIESAWENGAGELPESIAALPPTLRGLDAAEFVVHVLPSIEALPNVRVQTVGVQPDYRELTEAPQLTVTVVDTEQRDWFDLGVLVTVEGRTIPFAPLFAALSTGAGKLLMVDNTYLSLDHPAFDELKRLIDEAGTLAEWETGPRISRYQASFWAELEELADSTEQVAAWREAVGGLNRASVEPVEPPPLNAELRPYQADGFAWLAFLYDHGLGGVLADDMGLGKTLQAIALMARAKAGSGGAEPFLVVAPTSVVSNWATEIARFAPGLSVGTVTTTRRPLPTADVVVTSYALFRLDFARYSSRRWAGLVLDEAQFVKNPASKAHQCAVDLEAPFKLAITGTPMENSLMDLWALFRIVAPGLFPSSTRFTETWVKPITAGNREVLARLRRRIRPLLMRRTKELVADELPPKQEQVLQVDLSPRHRTLYDATLQRERQKLLGLVEDLDRNRFIVFRSLTLLRMLALDASLIDEDHADIASSKLDALLEHLDDVVAEGHRALVFSQFTSFLGRAAERLRSAGIPYEYLDGATQHRADVITRFREGVAPVFLISLKAGGFGLNLTEADYVFLLDPWWNPATEAQAIDRTHRIGQSKNVMVYRLVARDTIEEKVMALRDEKARLFDAVIDDDAVFATALTADDIRALLE